ncbi:hypothetical protein BDQ17DRAFT_1240532 [Cyathus striatus]|nr:hypothetical protein BDQ17DRAFT_1240532 [Cyathus striatus]
MSKITDPVADKSGFLCMYMSSHPDTLVAYAKWYGKVKENIMLAQMTGIDSKGMTLNCRMKDGSNKEVRVPIEPPLNGYDDVKPRLLEMKALAQEGLGMIKTPQVTTFKLPRRECIASGIFGAVLLYCYFAPVSDSAAFIPANIVRAIVGTAPISYLFYFIAVAHVLESLYTFTLCRRHQTPFTVGALYVFSTIFLGIPVWRSLRRHIQAIRIDSVMKIQ